MLAHRWLGRRVGAEMSVTLNLGWWMIPAFFHLAVCGFLAGVFYFDKDKSVSKAVLGLGVSITLCTLSVRYL